jgi:diguanylate cyclase (GGDEF)-like protein/PAS domain S-box-containing protein
MALPMLLVLAPIYLSLHFLVQTHHRGIATARNEIAGVPVISAVSQLRHAIIEEALGGDQAANRAAAARSRIVLAEAAARWPKDADLVKQSLASTAAADRYIRAGAPQLEDVSDLMAQLDGMYAVTSNASELILDPELDTYYLMDLNVSRLPQLIGTVWSMHRVHDGRSVSDDGDDIRTAKMEGYRALLKEQAQAVDNAYQFVRRHQRDRQVSQTLDQGMKRFDAAVQRIRLQGGMLQGMTGGHHFSAATHELLFAARAVEQLIGGELVRLLELRIKEFAAVRDKQIGFSAALIVLILTVMLVWLNREVVLPVKRVTATMLKLAAGDLQVEIRTEQRSSEIGDMVKAIAVFRDTAVTRIRLEQEADMAASELEQSTAALERAERAALLGNWRYEIAGERLSWSKSMFGITGFEASEGPPGLSAIAARVNQADLLRLVASLEHVSLTASTSTFDVRTHHPELGQRHVRLWIEVEFDDAGLPRSMFGTAQDVTELKVGQLELEARTKALAEAQAIGRIGNWAWRLNNTIVEWSPEIYDILGYDPATFTPELLVVRSLYVDDSLAAISEAQRNVLTHHGTEAVDVVALRADGSKADVTVITKADIDEAGKMVGFVGTIQDITDRKRAERDLEKLAFYDPLTGLANRALFQRSIRRYISAAKANARQAALFLIDLDKFKEVNDSLGHAAGDELLVIVAEKLRRGMPEDVFLARLGGDEFAVIIPDADRAAAEAIGWHIVDMFETTLQLKQGEVSIGTSIGFVTIPEDGTEAEDLLRKADLALYRAKDDGRNRLQRFLPELSEIVQEKNRLARDLRRAMESNSGLEVHYQPQFNPTSGQVTGYEALLRWKHPERGFISPTEFIPIAESAALICDLGLWVMREGCKQMQSWIGEGHAPRDIAINVSATQLWQGEFEDDVRRILAETGLAPGLLTLEVTESVFVKEGEGRIARILSNLRALGVTLALDDFGTGYSSLGYLNQLPFQRLKVDRVFVAGVDSSEQRQRLLRGIIELGRGMGMTLIAEGAERPEEVAVLRRFGCDRIQGFVFSRPMPADDTMRATAAVEANWRKREAA